MFNSIIDGNITVSSFLICTAVSLVLGICTAFVNMYRSKSSGSFAVALAVLPTVVETVILLVNGNIGAGIAVAGAFSLVRFRSAPGNAKEISAIFLCMAIGLASGMGYVALAAVLFVIVASAMLIMTALKFGEASEKVRIIKVTIPENLDYDGLFDDVFSKYTSEHSLEKVKTVSMGTLYELWYRVALIDEPVKKEFLDEMRCRNGNLCIVCCKESSKESL